MHLVLNTRQKGEAPRSQGEGTDSAFRSWGCHQDGSQNTYGGGRQSGSGVPVSGCKPLSSCVASSKAHGLFLLFPHLQNRSTVHPASQGGGERGVGSDAGPAQPSCAVRFL